MSMQSASPELLQALEQLWTAMRRAGDMVLHLRTENIGLRERATLLEEQNYEQQKRLISLEINAEELVELRHKVDEYDEEILRKEEVIADMTRDLAHKEGTLRAMDEQAARHTERIKELEHHTNEMQKTVGELTTEATFLRERTQAFDTLHEEMRRTREDKEILQKELVQRNKELIRHSNEVAGYKETIAQLQNQLLKQEQEFDSRLHAVEHSAKVEFSEQLDKASSRYNQLLAEYDSAKEHIMKERERVHDEMRAVQQHYEEELSTMRNTQNEEVELLQLELALTKQDVQEQRATIVQLREEINIERTKSSMATTDLQKTMEEHIAQISAQLAQAEQTESELRSTIEEAAKRYEQTQTEVSAREEVILALRAQLEQARLHIDEEKAQLRADVEQALHLVEEQLQQRESIMM